MSTMGSSHLLESQTHILRGRLDSAAQRSSATWQVQEEHKNMLQAIIELRLSCETSTLLSERRPRRGQRDEQDLGEAVGAVKSAAAVPPELLLRLETALVSHRAKEG